MTKSKTTEPLYRTKETVVVKGMTLRDYFAAKAMQSLLDSGYYSELSNVDRIHSLRANEAYRIADSMLKARAEK